jgi:hypothetical protein
MSRSLFGMALAAVMLAAVPSPSAAQVGRPAAPPDWRLTPTWGAGYMASMPRALIGGMVYMITPRFGGTGVFVDGRLTHESHEDDALFEPGITSAQAQTQYGDLYVQTVEHWRALRVGLIRPLTPDFALFAGAGYGHGRIYDEYYDNTETRGRGGNYRARNEVDSGGRLSATGGAMFRFGSNLSFQFALDMAPAGFAAGASIFFQ